jgi:hypothetical protein
MGFYNQTEESLDKFAEYYEYMQKWTDTPMYLTVDTCHLHFSDEEIQDYCENIADRLAYLYHKKGVKHIRYYCLSNELSRKRHGNLVKDMPTFKKYHEYFYRAFLKRNLPIGLLSTDATEYENWNTVDWALKNMNEITDDVCVHIYHREHMPEDPAFYDFFYGKCVLNLENIVVAIAQVNEHVAIVDYGQNSTDSVDIVVRIRNYDHFHNCFTKSQIAL